MRRIIEFIIRHTQKNAQIGTEPVFGFISHSTPDEYE